MIDEDLYKIATDELNSDARKPDVWARACALASDDHDEARFLYTNLRVEEMLNKDGRQRTFSTTDKNRDGMFTSAESTNTTKPVNGDEQADMLRLDATGAQNEKLTDLLETDVTDNVTSLASSRAGKDSVVAPLPTDELDSFELDDLDAPASASGTDALSDKVIEFDDETMAELAALSDENASSTETLSGITGKPTDANQSINDDSVKNDDFVTNVFGASAAETRKQILSENQMKSSISTEPANEDQPNDKPVSSGQNVESVPHSTYNEIDELPKTESDQWAGQQDHDATAEAANSDIAYAAANSVESEFDEDANNAVAADYADANHIIDDEDTLGITSELDTGIGRSFMVFNQHGALKAVKRGVSWPAMLFTFPWLLSKALFGTALAYACLWVVSMGGLLVTATHWINTGADASMSIKLWTGAFALLAIIGLLYIPFRYGNRWVAEKLQNRGYRYEASVSAENKLDAVDRLLRFNQETLR